MSGPEFIQNDNIEWLLPFFIKHSHAAVAIKDIKGRYLHANQKFTRYANAKHEKIIGHFDKNFLPPERARTLHTAEKLAISKQAGISCEENILIDDSHFPYLSTRFPIFNEQQDMIALGIVALDASNRYRDISEIERSLKTAEQINEQLRDTLTALEQLAGTDRLTQAWNRRRFEETVDNEIHRANRYAHPVSMLLLDIDHFKAINDAYGHLAGDRVLVQVADRMREALRKTDSLTRWGGEEFIVLMPNTGMSHAIALAERIQQQLAAHAFDGVGQVTASIGVAEYQPGSSHQEWLERTDRAMYKAKHDGRNRIEVDTFPGTRESRAEHIEGSIVQLVWKDAFLCGNPHIDAQHRGLFDLSNELLKAVLSERPADEISLIVAKLLEDIMQHFKDEEKILEQIGFRGLQQHAAKHAKLIDKGLELALDFREGRLLVGNLFQFLAYDVVTRHFLGADREFFPLTMAQSQRQLSCGPNAA